MSHSNARLTGLAVRRLQGLAIAAVPVLALTGTPAHADVRSEPRTAVVNYADLDLTRDVNVKTLYQRLQAAAQAVCEPFDRREVARRAKLQPCLDEALSAGVRDVNQQQLSALHARRGRPMAQPMASST